jgi:hypothetical protein
MSNPFTLVVGSSSEIFYGNLPVEARNERFRKCPQFDIDFEGESITVISQNNHRIPKGTPELQNSHSSNSFTPPSEKGESPNAFIKKHYGSVNVSASRITNLLDDTHDNYIVGECVFVFEENTVFNEDVLKMMFKDFIFNK